MARLLCGLALFAAIAGAGPALASDATPDQFERKLQRYDPATVAAAQSYARTFEIEQLFAKSIPLMTQSPMKQRKDQNPAVDEQRTKKFVDAFLQNARVDRAPVLEQATILMMLESLDKEELVALNQFHFSPVGARTSKKTPILIGRLPELTRVMETYVVPRAIEAGRAHPRANGADVGL